MHSYILWQENATPDYCDTSELSENWKSSGQPLPKDCPSVFFPKKGGQGGLLNNDWYLCLGVFSIIALISECSSGHYFIVMGIKQSNHKFLLGCLG